MLTFSIWRFILCLCCLYRPSEKLEIYSHAGHIKWWNNNKLHCSSMLTYSNNHGTLVTFNNVPETQGVKIAQHDCFVLIFTKLYWTEFNSNNCILPFFMHAIARRIFFFLEMRVTCPLQLSIIYSRMCNCFKETTVFLKRYQVIISPRLIYLHE